MMLHRSRLSQLNLIMTVIGLMHKPFILSCSKTPNSLHCRVIRGMLLSSHSMLGRVLHDLAAWKRNVLR
jgi:hypothetical protein